MNSKFSKQILTLVMSLMAHAVFSDTSHLPDTLSRLSSVRVVGDADVNITDRYALPPSKVYIEPCQRKALLLHPGLLEKQRILHRNGGFWLRFEIQEHEGSEWFMLCDLASGKIIREQKLVDDAN